MIITSSIYNQSRWRTKALLRELAAFFGDKDISVPDIMAYVLVQDPAIDFTQLIRDIGPIVKYLNISTHKILYISDNPFPEIEEIVTAFKISAPREKDFVMWCMALFFPFEQVNLSKKSDYIGGIYKDYKLPEWLATIMNRFFNDKDDDYLFSETDYDKSINKAQYFKANTLLKSKWKIDVKRYRVSKLSWMKLEAKLLKSQTFIFVRLV